VADEQDGASLTRNVAHLADALLLECLITHGKHFIDEQDLRLQVRGDGEREAEIHAARVVLHRGVDELLHLCERDDLIELPRRVGARHSEDRAVQEDVLPSRQLWMEPGSYLQ